MIASERRVWVSHMNRTHTISSIQETVKQYS
jgi:predicted small metal-binding protein